MMVFSLSDALCDLHAVVAETRQALQLLEKIQRQLLHETEGSHLNPTVREDLHLLISVLNSPVFTTILNIQAMIIMDSLQELKRQLHQHPSILPVDFDISPTTGELVLNVPLEPTALVPTPSPPPPAASTQQLGGEPITTESYAEEFRRTVERGAMGREVATIRLFKADGASLGFSVVGLRSENRGEIGIFVQEIQDNGIAARWQSAI
ncbi:hypothetical protein LAZ67_3003128 [Cordylochernes scorpioides]|uniref:PDZ domain-containing protein n=1 Tax=Cordylochernes scorpioides TaxID=51811 RepID=A0ABY6K8D4_9ARAC|nr:hypothetical protein LAZ67_3003128 [Cordylochernes scorpioides]